MRRAAQRALNPDTVGKELALRIAIIGAGVAGLTLATRLAGAGHPAVVFDKGRGVGGRTSTRRADDGFRFDHGAQYFTVRDPKFRAFLDRHVPAGAWARWDGRFGSLEGGQLVPETRTEARYVGIPGMNALCRGLAENLDVRLAAKVASVAGSPGAWTLVVEGGREEGPFDWVVATAPPVQSAALLGGLSPIAAEAAGVAMQACFALLIEGGPGAKLPFDGIRCGDHPVLGWAADDGSKPGREGKATLVVQSSNAWAEAHRDDDHPAIAVALRTAAVEALGLETGETWSESVHRWLHAKPVEPLGRPCLIDREGRLAACGDWCVAGKVEGAFLSGDACASALLEAFG